MKEYMDNYSDISDENGFQFEFHCESCGHQHRTPYERFTRGAVGDAVTGMLGGILGSVVGTKVEKMQRDAQDNALEKAMADIVAMKVFQRCSVCSNWVCANCWTPQENSCKNCSVVMAAQRQAQIMGQSAASMTQAIRDPEGTVPKGGLMCAVCGKPAGTGKFCQECGASLGPANCPGCGAALAVGAKFCGECGQKLS